MFNQSVMDFYEMARACVFVVILADIEMRSSRVYGNSIDNQGTTLSFLPYVKRA